MQMKIKYFKIRKAVAIIFAIAIAVCCAHHSSFQSVAATAMKNTAVQNTVQMPQVYPCGFPVGIYMETEGVMVVTTAQIPTNMETLSSQITPDRIAFLSQLCYKIYFILTIV